MRSMAIVTQLRNLLIGTAPTPDYRSAIPLVVRYRMHLESRHFAPCTINLRLGAVRRFAYEAADCGLISRDLAADCQQAAACSVKALNVHMAEIPVPETLPDAHRLAVRMAHRVQLRTCR
jgi:hypothetical protein